MRVIVISILCAPLLLACGKTPEDPGRPRKPVLPGTGAPSGEVSGDAGVPLETTPPRRREPVTRWM